MSHANFGSVLSPVQGSSSRPLEKVVAGPRTALVVAGFRTTPVVAGPRTAS